MKELEHYVPESHGTQLYYLIASTAIHAPFRNNHFGSPPTVFQSLWKGIMIWRRWRKFIQYNLKHLNFYHMLESSTNFQSFLHFLIYVHQSRGIEAIHGTHRGGTTSLPSTSANLSFKEFLSWMNQTMQIHTSEHMLQQISGNPIVATCTRKKKLTNAKKVQIKVQIHISIIYQIIIRPLSNN